MARGTIKAWHKAQWETTCEGSRVENVPMSTRFQIRSFRRFAIQCPIYYSNDKFHGKGTAWNLSLNGWRVDGTLPVETGMAFTLCIFLPGRVRTVFVDRAAVRWSRGHEFGIELVAMKNDQHVVLKDFVGLLI